MRRVAPILLAVSFAAVAASAVAQTADLAVAQTASPGKVAADTDLTYAIVVTNKGPDGASATLDAVLPAGVSFVSFTAPAGWQKSHAGGRRRRDRDCDDFHPDERRNGEVRPRRSRGPGSAGGSSDLQHGDGHFENA